MNDLLNFWLVIRHLLPVILAIAVLVLIAFVLDTKLSDREW